MKKIPTLLTSFAMGALITVGASAPSIAIGASVPSIGSIVGVAYDPPCTQKGPDGCWQGWGNAYQLPADGGNYLFSFPMGVVWLPASFSGNALTLAPNTSVSIFSAGELFWWKPDGTANAILGANMLVVDDTLGGQTMTFSGTVLSNTLVSPYVSKAFVREFDPYWGMVQSVEHVLVAGDVFQLTLTITPGNHVEYGFETVGPPTTPDSVGSLGSVQVGPVPATLVQQLLRHVTGVGPGTSLADKVKLAWVYYFSGNKQEVCGDMTGFVNEVAAQRGKKLTQAQAVQFTSEAGVFMASIDCK